jgi:hypothetical protein
MERRERSDQYAYLKMVLSTKENGLLTRTRKTEEESRSGLMEAGMMASGEMEWPMVKED